MLRESSENQFGRAIEKFDKIFEFFLKTRPPRENARSTPGLQVEVKLHNEIITA